MRRSREARPAAKAAKEKGTAMTMATEVALVFVFFIAAVVNGVAGLGFALLASAFAAVIVDPKLAVLLLGAVTRSRMSSSCYCTAATAE